MNRLDVNEEINFATPVYHVAFLRNKLRKRVEDRYLVDIAILLKKHGHKVVIYASEFNPKDCLDEVNPLTGEIPVVFSGWWLPNAFKCLRSLVMSLRIILFPGMSKPKFIFVDVHPFALVMLSKFTKSKTFYVEHFTSLKHADFFTQYMQITNTLFSARCLRYADAIITQSGNLTDIFQRSYPRVKNTIKSITPLVDCGLWLQDTIDIQRIVPDLQQDANMFVVFGNYMKRSNFRIALDAFEQLLLLLDNDLKTKVHMVIAGVCSEHSLEQRFNYNELIETTKEKYFASQITFLKQLPTIHKRTLIERSIGLVYPAKHDPFPEAIIAGISLKKPIITTNTGFAKDVLTHRISGILVDADASMFAAAMYKILMNPLIERFLSDMAYDIYRTQYSSTGIFKKLHNLFESIIENDDKIKNE